MGEKLVAGVVAGRPFSTIASFNLPRYFEKSAGDDTSTSIGDPETRPFVLGLHASGWAIATLFRLSEVGAHIIQAVFFICGMAVMVAFVRAARRVERLGHSWPLGTRDEIPHVIS